MLQRKRLARPASLGLVACLLAPALIGCGSNKPDGASMPPVDDTRGGNTSAAGMQSGGGTQASSGMSTKEKVVLLAGAAALYYMYKHHKDAQGKEVQYYQSKNGRIYYRDANKQAHWVTPPTQPIQVPAADAQDAIQYRGYNNNNSGADFGGAYTQ